MSDNERINIFRDNILSELNKINSTARDELIRYLKISDFFDAPASTKYHGAYPGGLAEHSWHVFILLRHKNTAYNLGLMEDSIRITGLLHDVCKIGVYFKQDKWRKNDQGKWEIYQAWSKEDSMPLGHGEKSVILLQRFFELLDQEIYMIRWHMGAFDGDLRTFNDAVKIHPCIVALHTADFEASTYLDGKAFSPGSAGSGLSNVAAGPADLY